MQVKNPGSALSGDDELHNASNVNSQSACTAEANLSESLRALSPEQLLVIDELVNARAAAAHELAGFTTDMQQAITARDIARYRQASRKARDSVAQCHAYTVAIQAALKAFTKARKGSG